MKHFPTLLAAVALAAVLSPPPACAQAYFSTFGPGDSYRLSGPNSAWISGAVDSYGQPFSAVYSTAQGFRYSGGAGVFLAQIRVALWPTHWWTPIPESPFTISFRQGPDMNHTVTLEEWIDVYPPVPGVYTMSSVIRPAMTPDDMFWVVVENSGHGDWYMNDQGYVGLSARGWDGGTVWRNYPNLASAAFDVTLTPEPLSMILLGTGLLGVGAAARRRRKERDAEG